MSITIAERNETIDERNETVVALEDVETKQTVVALELEDEAADYLAGQGAGHDAPAQAHPSRLGDYLRTPDPADTADRPEGGPALAVFCYEDPDSLVGQYVSWAVGLVAARGTPV